MYRYSTEPIDRRICEIKSVVEIMGQSFKREALQDEINRLGLYTEDDLVLEH